jgi:hypothetical protein
LEHGRELRRARAVVSFADDDEGLASGTGFRRDSFQPFGDAVVEHGRKRRGDDRVGVDPAAPVSQRAFERRDAGDPLHAVRIGNDKSLG